MTNNQIFAVMTGDIVGSSNLKMTHENRVVNVIQSAAENVSSYFQNSIHYGIDVFRGDSWQMVITKPEDSLRIGLLLRATLQSTPDPGRLDTRFSIGFGSIDYLPDNQISTGNGAAFLLSGKGLDNCTKNNYICLEFPEANHSPTTRALNIIVKLIDLNAQRWTKKQSEAVAGALVGLTQREIASTWVKEPVTQQAISQHLESAGWIQINDSLEYFEEILSTLYQDH